MTGKSHDRIDRTLLIGQRSGRRTIIAVDPIERRWISLTVRCDCGAEESTNYVRFRRNVTGCKRCRAQGINRTHGRSGERLYHIWQGMKFRCGPDASRRYRKYYYDKGIRVCEEWQDYEAFCEWSLANGYREGLSLDRISPAFGYSPANCEWVTPSENASRMTRHSTYPMGEIIRQTPPRALLLALNGVS